MKIEHKGYTGVVTESGGIYTGKITAPGGAVVWEDGCDVEKEMNVWVLDAFKDFVYTDEMPRLYYGD